MRVLVWTELYWPYIGGVEILAARTISLLRARGYEFAVVTSHAHLDLPDEDVHDGICIYRFQFWQALVERKIELLLEARNGVARLKRSFRPELVHIYLTDPSVFFHLQTTDTYPRPTLLSLHVGLPRLVAKEGSLLRRTLRSAQWVTATSEAMLKQARQIAPDIIPYSSFVYNGTEPPEVPVKPLPLEPPTILCVGRLVSDKGFDLAVTAFATLSKQFPRARMIIAGDGAARQPLEDQVRRLGIDERVKFPGWVKHEDIPALMNEATVVVMPSRWEEAFGLVAVEAALMERPIVTTRVGGLPEVVADGLTGFVVEKEDVRGLALAIGRLLKNPEGAIEMGRAARKRAERMFNLAQHVKAYDDLYKMLMTNHSRSAHDCLR